MAEASFRFEVGEVLACLRQIEALLPELGEAGAKAVDGFLRAVEAGDEIILVQGDPGAAAAGEAVVGLYPSDGLRRLVATLGAGNV